MLAKMWRHGKKKHDGWNTRVSRGSNDKIIPAIILLKNKKVKKKPNICASEWEKIEPWLNSAHPPVLPQSLFIMGGSPGGTSVVIVSLSEAPRFAVLRLALPEGGDAALVPAQRGDDAFLELVFGLWRQRVRRCAGALFHLGELQVHVGAVEGDSC